ncbi:DUF1376 domain-containing protein [Burkholderia pseudomallei]|uniref:DUF1376 domain-containing protein n=1 Tax=Burkholderia pseudomallei TaxID=28450 RepID=UPI0005E69512|nr:DUF1376 domain-containing protein [Burkholderia pseudomallei]CFL83513.1 Uncharacterised protein [Burkholderia pseudomallei]
MNDLPNPLTPADCDLRDFPFMPLDVQRLCDSDLAALESPEACWAALLLWSKSWHQVPAASLPDDDRVLAKFTGYQRAPAAWQAIRDGALRGWIKCSDGRLYHPVVAEKANEGWFAKHRQAHDKLCERVRKRNKTRAEAGLVPLEVPELEQWIDAGRPLEKALFPEEFRTTSVGKSDASAGMKKDFQRNGDGIPVENALKGKEGKGQGEVNTVGTVVSSGKPARTANDDCRPKDAAEWLRHLRDKHGFEADPTNVNDRKKLWPVFAGWTNAGLTTAFVDDAIAAAIRDASEPIVCLPLYVDRCMANANAARASPNPSWTDQNAQTIAALTGRNRSHEPDDRTIDV